MSVHVRVITPIISTGLVQASDFEGILDPDDTLDFTELDEGPASVESGYDAALAVPDTIAKIRAAEAEGVDAVVIDCMGDPGLVPGRECVKIPVLGPCQMAMSIASTLGHRYSVLSISRATHASFLRRAREYGVADKYASTRSIDIRVANLRAQSDLRRERLLVAAKAAIEEDGADTLIIGCTQMFGAARQLEQDLAAEGLDIPVIDPVPLTVKLAKTFVEIGLSHSKYAFATPARLRAEERPAPPLTAVGSNG
ncbi:MULTISPECIES: aspartate/glutamate racemase family protein [unclassified Roseovarius]|uniref:aspartate/glutamate racemase family protein n=1 Tax=unclassified Roseovarius TaxID=2614913 RepID=UPI00273E6E97|nr:MULTISPECIES: aspartate/glutamate racemase family protein [unclassified Roseovarius]